MRTLKLVLQKQLDYRVFPWLEEVGNDELNCD